MKLLSLALSRIAGYLRYQRLTFALFFVGITLACFVFTYFYGNARQVEVSSAENRVEYRTYLLMLTENTPITQEQLHVLDQFGIKDVQVGCHVTLDPEALSTQPDGAESVIKVYALLHNGDALSGDEGGPVMTPQQLEQRGLIIDKSYGVDRTEITVNGISFPVLGTVSNTGGALQASFDTYMAEFGQADYLFFLTQRVLTQQEQEEVEAILTQTFPNIASYLAPDFFIQVDQSVSASTMGKVSLLFLVSLLSFLFLFQYLQQKNYPENLVYRLTGCPRRSLFLVVTLEVLLLAGSACLLACLLHHGLYPQIARLNTAQVDLGYALSDYLTILGLTLGLSLLASIPFFFLTLRGTLSLQKARYGA